MSSIQQVMSGLGGSAALVPANVFKVNLRTGTGAAANVTGVPFAPDLYIGKGRSGATAWGWYDTTRGATFDLDSTGSAVQTTQSTGITSFNSDGVSIGTLAKLNTGAATYADYLIKKAAKFHDQVLWAGDGTDGKAFNHALGITPGLIILKISTGSTSGWAVWHTSLGNVDLFLNSTAASAADNGAVFGNAGTTTYIAPTSTQFTVSSAFNGVGHNHIAYLFAHDTSASSISYCGTFTADGSGNATITGLPFRPQFLLAKRTDSTGNWRILDTTRGWAAGANTSRLVLNDTFTEQTSAAYGAPTSNGFTVDNSGSNWDGPSAVYIYWAIKA